MRAVTYHRIARDNTRPGDTLDQQERVIRAWMNASPQGPTLHNQTPVDDPADDHDRPPVDGADSDGAPGPATGKG
jgi:hypothetical protein